MGASNKRYGKKVNGSTEHIGKLKNGAKSMAVVCLGSVVQFSERRSDGGKGRLKKGQAVDSHRLITLQV